MDKNFIKFEIEEATVVDEEIENSQFATARLKVFSSGFNLNKLYCSNEALQKTAKSIENCPILYNFETSVWGRYDFGTHTDPEKALICGFILPGSITFEKSDDGEYCSLIVIGKIWKKYSEKVLNIFSRNSKKKISVEMELSDSCKMKDYSNITEMLDFTYFGVCLLGDMIAEGSPGANIDIISFARENEEYKKAYSKEFSNKDKFNSRYKELDLFIPKNIKLSAQKSIDLSKEKPNSINAVYMSIARHLVNSEKVSIDKVKLINKKIKSKSNAEFGTSDYLSFMAMGGDDAIEWSNDLSNKINELDNKKISYFEIKKEIEENNQEMEVDNLMKDKNMEKEVDDEDKNEEVDMGVENKEESVFQEAIVDEKNMAAEENKTNDKKDEEVETPKQEKEESPEKEKDEEKKGVEKKMALSLDAYMDVSAVMGMLVEQTVDNKVIADKYSAGELGEQDIVYAMFDTMCQMAEKIKTMSIENSSLKEKNMSLSEFKEKIEKDNFTLQVESFMQDFQAVLPIKDIESAKEDSLNFSLNTLDVWKNKVEATAYRVSAGKGNIKKDYTSVAMPFDDNKKVDNGVSKSPWKR